MKSIREMSQIELAAFVQEHLRKHGIRTVLSGGAAVMFYAQNRYVTKDVDLITLLAVHRRELRRAMGELGFVEKGRYFVHPDTPYIVEFPSGPLSVGEEPVRDIHEICLPTGRLTVLSPTDCVKDRLSAFFHWNDSQSLEQAVMVCLHNSVDLDEVARWSEAEGFFDKFLDFQAELRRKRQLR